MFKTQEVCKTDCTSWLAALNPKAKHSQTHLLPNYKVVTAMMNPHGFPANSIIHQTSACIVLVPYMAPKICEPARFQSCEMRTQTSIDFYVNDHDLLLITPYTRRQLEVSLIICIASLTPQVTSNPRSNTHKRCCKLLMHSHR